MPHWGTQFPKILNQEEGSINQIRKNQTYTGRNCKLIEEVITNSNQGQPSIGFRFEDSLRGSSQKLLRVTYNKKFSNHSSQALNVKPNVISETIFPKPKIEH